MLLYLNMQQGIWKIKAVTVFDSFTSKKFKF